MTNTDITTAAQMLLSAVDHAWRGCDGEPFHDWTNGEGDECGESMRAAITALANLALERYGAAPATPAGWGVTYDGKTIGRTMGKLDAEDEARRVGGTARAVPVFIGAAPAAQAQPAPVPVPAEPVAIIRTWTKNGDRHAELWDWSDGVNALPEGQHKVYAAPAAPVVQQPIHLSDAQIKDIANGLNGVQPKLGQWERDLRLAREVLAAAPQAPNGRTVRRLTDAEIIQLIRTSPGQYGSLSMALSRAVESAIATKNGLTLAAPEGDSDGR